jgi:16S rRNA (uracil1498-N3)-methyltransferase
MPQIFVSPQNLDDNRFLITGDEAHHVVNVLRKKPQDTLTVFDGEGRRVEGVILSVAESPLRVTGQITKQLSKSARPILLRLFQGLPRGSKFDYVIEKATELGVDEIIPFLSEKNPIEIDAEQSASKVDRWLRVAEAAAKQCSRDTLPDVSPVLAFSDLKSHLQGTSIVLWERDAKPLREVLQRFVMAWGSRSGHTIFNIIIGPESGFSPTEFDQLVEQGVQPASLGRRTLRTETAGLAALAIVNYELDLF